MSNQSINQSINWINQPHDKRPINQSINRLQNSSINWTCYWSIYKLQHIQNEPAMILNNKLFIKFRKKRLESFEFFMERAQKNVKNHMQLVMVTYMQSWLMQNADAATTTLPLHFPADCVGRNLFRWCKSRWTGCLWILHRKRPHHRKTAHHIHRRCRRYPSHHSKRTLSRLSHPPHALPFYDEIYSRSREPSRKIKKSRCKNDRNRRQSL